MQWVSCSGAHCSSLHSSFDKMSGSIPVLGRAGAFAGLGSCGHPAAGCCIALHSPDFQHNEEFLSFFKGWGGFGGGEFCRKGRVTQGSEEHLAWAPWVFLVVGNGAVSSKGVFGKALKFPFQAVEKHLQPRGMDWKRH